MNIVDEGPDWGWSAATAYAVGLIATDGCLDGRRPIVSLDQLMEEIGLEPIDPQTLDAERVEAERKLQEYDEFLAIRSTILELPIKYQEVIMLRYFERKGVKEIAEILNKKEGTVKSLLSRGIRKLKNLL